MLSVPKEIYDKIKGELVGKAPHRENLVESSVNASHMRRVAVVERE